VDKQDAHRKLLALQNEPLAQGELSAKHFSLPLLCLRSTALGLLITHVRDIGKR